MRISSESPLIFDVFFSSNGSFKEDLSFAVERAEKKRKLKTRKIEITQGEIEENKELVTAVEGRYVTIYTS